MLLGTFRHASPMSHYPKKRSAPYRRTGNRSSTPFGIRLNFKDWLLLAAGGFLGINYLVTPNDNPDASTSSGAYYRYCSDARAAGAAPLYRNQPGYREGLDRDGDGVACEPYLGN